jgi:hypothetical protein
LAKHGASARGTKQQLQQQIPACGENDGGGDGGEKTMVKRADGNDGVAALAGRD